MERCDGFCGEGAAPGSSWALVLLAGAQVGNPSTDAIRPALAEGPRLGLDATYGFSALDVVRARAWVDWLHVNDTGQSVTDLAAETQGFVAVAPDADLGVDASLDVLAAQREELTPDDFAQFQVHPYRVVDAEAELCPRGPKVDKDGRVALPIGYARRERWDLRTAGGPGSESRDTLSAAAALRGVQPGRRAHVQLDVLRVTRTLWRLPGGEADGWALTAGYQRLSPGIDELQIWLLAGYGWYDGRAEAASTGDVPARHHAQGPLAQTGAVVDLGDAPGDLQFRGGFDAHFEPDRAAGSTGRFARLLQWRAGYGQRAGWLRWDLDVEGVALDRVATLHAVTPALAVEPWGRDALSVGLRYRFAVAHDERRADAPDRDRFSMGVDWAF